MTTGDMMMMEDEVRIPGKEMMTGAVFPGLVFIEKLENDDLMMTSCVALRRPNNDHIKVLRSPCLLSSHSVLISCLNLLS